MRAPDGLGEVSGPDREFVRGFLIGRQSLPVALNHDTVNPAGIQEVTVNPRPVAVITLYAEQRRVDTTPESSNAEVKFTIGQKQ